MFELYSHLSLSTSPSHLFLSLPLSLSPSLPLFLTPPLSLPPRKLTLENLYWSVFESEEERENNGRQFVQLVQEQLTKPTAEVSPTPPCPPSLPFLPLSVTSEVHKWYPIRKVHWAHE